jgi:hypothetical protein
MVVTFLAVLFLLLVTAIAVAGFRMFSKRGAPNPSETLQKCSLCLRSFQKNLLIERQVGDMRLLHFCRDCILTLYSDLGLKN